MLGVAIPSSVKPHLKEIDLKRDLTYFSLF